MATQQWCNKVNIQLSGRGLEHINKERANLALNAGPEVKLFNANTHIHTKSHKSEQHSCLLILYIHTHTYNEVAGVSHVL